MKIFEKIQLSDGGPNDRGFSIGYIRADSKDHARKLLNINHGFIEFIEVSEREYVKRKSQAYRHYKSTYNI